VVVARLVAELLLTSCWDWEGMAGYSRCLCRWLPSG
jgi:hypothetical protein